MNNDTTTIEKKEPLPLESLAPLSEQNAAREKEKGLYWNRLLTGNLATVPLEVRRKAGADNEAEPAEIRDYRLASNINRSWVVDHKGMSREQVQAAWPELRLNMAKELGVDDDEQELYAALSIQQEEEPRRRQVRDLYQEAYGSSLRGENKPLPEDATHRRIWELAREEAESEREEYMPLAEALSAGWTALKSMESDVFPVPDMFAGGAGLMQAVDALADMEPAERAKVYEVARSLESTRQLDDGTLNLGRGMLRRVRRGVADLRHSLVQGIGHMGTALTKAAGETLDSETLQSGAEYMDKRLRTLDELRRVAQGEVYPVKLGDDSSFAEELALDAAGAAPGAALAFMGGAGFGALTLAGTGAAVAEARHRSPEGRQELQTAAGIVGGALQAGIYMGMSRLGAQMLDRSINHFLKARNAGLKGYSLAALNTLSTLTAENAKLLLAGKAAQVAELGMQELAARVDRVASNIAWEAYGDNILDIETNMREAAMNLPFILIAAGRAALHHFRSPDIVLQNRPLLAEWGVDDALLRRIMEAPDSQTRTKLLRDTFRGSRRWGGAGSLEECVRALRLLNTDYQTDFKNEQVVRQFLNLPAGKNMELRPPESVQTIAQKMKVQDPEILKRKDCVDYMRLWDEWNQKGQGDWWREEANFNERLTRYAMMRAYPKSQVPPEYRLDGYYNPHQVQVVQLLRKDLQTEIVSLSYRLLMNMESLSSLTHTYQSAGHAREHTEKRRCRFISKVCEAVERRMLGEDPKTIFAEFNQWLITQYDNLRRVPGYDSHWMQEAEKQRLLDIADKRIKKQRLNNWKSHPELKKFYAISMGAQACAETLAELIPHCADFQQLLTQGYSPEHVVPHLLGLDFAGQLDAATWKPQALDPATRNMADYEIRLAQNSELCNRYMQLSGHSLESTPDGQGGQLWRLPRPDGSDSEWFATAEEAINSLAGNVKNLFLPMGEGMLYKNIEKAYRYDAFGKLVFHQSLMYRLPQRAISLFDHMGRTAAEDLRQQWLGNATQYALGLEFAPDKDNWFRYKGKRLQYGIKEMKKSNDAFLLTQRKVETPYSMIKSRFFVYWHRLLSSGWVAPEDVADALVQAGEITRKKRNEVIAQGQPRRIYWKNKPGAERRRLQRRYPDGMLPGNIHVVNSFLARRMSQLNMLYLLSDLQQAQLPPSVREWFYSSAFCQVHREKKERYTKGPVGRENRTTAEVIQGFIPRVQEIRKLRESEKGLKLSELMREAYQPSDARRYEQGWCFAVGGASAFRSAGQSFWNLLEDPARGWQLLTPAERSELHNAIRDICGERSPEAALQELSDVLREYPGLRAYSADIRLGGQVKRMEFTPSGFPEGAALARDVVMPEAQMKHPHIVKNGFTVDEHASLPAEWAQDARVLPALQLQSELRRQVSAAPYTDEEGIWWKQERYGGVDGKYPPGLDNRWTPEPGLESFMNFFARVAELGHAYGAKGQLNVCGVSMGGIRPGELDMEQLRHVTVYRTYRMPELQVRLMPGEPNAANPYQRKPYIVHSADGVPLFPKRMAHSREEIMQSFAPLNTFKSDLERAYDYYTNRHRRRKQVDDYLKELLDRRAASAEAWYEANESSISNAELFMQLFQDNRVSYHLEGKDPTRLTRGEALVAELSRLMLLAEYGVEREAHVAQLVEFCGRVNSSREDKQLLHAALYRIVSPEPDRLKKEELPRDEEDRNLDLSPEDAEYY